MADDTTHHGPLDRLLHAGRRVAHDTINSLDADSFYVEGADVNDTKAPQGEISERWD